jgi:hypothetical protein
MGLKDRTAISMIRLQRRNAEVSSLQAADKIHWRISKRVSFSPIDPSKQLRNRSLSPHLNRKENEDSHRLIQRLRQALLPHSECDLASKEYASLQDELQRLTMHVAQQKSRISSDHPLEDLNLASFYGQLESPDSLPYRTLKIARPLDPSEGNTPSWASHSIERLHIAPSDLSSYRQTMNVPIPVAQAPNLTLVNSEETTPPEAQDLLIDEEVQLGLATAQLTQQALQGRDPHSVQTSIQPEVALSLLDS